jgi:hypothetical protein
MACLNVCEDLSADIHIVTAEGDKVTLSSDQHSEATLLTYDRLAYGNSGYEAEQGQLVGYDEQRTVSVSVEGELSDKELGDIQALLSDLGRMLKSFLTGKGEGSVEGDSADLSPYGSLSAFEAGFEYHAGLQALNVGTDQLTIETAGWPRPSEAMPASPPTASMGPVGVQPPQPLAPTSTPVQQPAPAAPLVDTSQADPAGNDEAARALAGKVKDSGLRPRRFMKLLKKFLRGFMREMRANHRIDDEQAKRGETILEKFFDQIEKPSSGPEAQAREVSVKQQWVSLQYELRADVQMQPTVEETV